jgi:hypothetical protein
MTYRKIDVSGEERRPAPKHAKPELAWVPIEKLTINDSYQRTIERRGWSSIRKIADHFDWGRFSPLLVARNEDDSFSIIDGQHRAHAAALCGVYAVPALVVDLTEQQQAAAFSWVNGTVTALTPLQIYRAALAALEPWALQCDAAVARAGCRMMTFNKSASEKKPGEIYCVALIRGVIEAGHADHLVAVLEGLRNSPVNGAEQVHYNSGTLRALVAAAVDLGITNSEVIEGFLTDHDIWDIAKKVDLVRRQPEFRQHSYTRLFTDSMRTLLRAWQRDRAAA